MKYELSTKIDFSCNIGRESNREVFTMEGLGFTQEELETKPVDEIEKSIHEYFLDWQENYLDSGWAITEED